MGNWTDNFQPPRGNGPHGPSPPTPEARDDAVAALDLTEYRPWVLQRGRSAGPMFIDLRRYEPRSGLFEGWCLGYPNLLAFEYIGETMVSLDFGSRHFVIQGQQLGELARHLQQGSVVAVLEYSSKIWPTRAPGPTITSIKKFPEIKGPFDA